MSLNVKVQQDGGVIANDAIKVVKAVALGQVPYFPIPLPLSTALINQHVSAVYVITYAAGACAITLPAPTAGAQSANGDDGVRLVFTSDTAQAHVITATGLFQDGAAHVNTATFAANAGGGIELVAYNGKWKVVNLQGVTMA